MNGDTASHITLADPPVYWQGPDMLILASNFWDAALWWEQGHDK